MDWISLLAALVGGVIGVAGSLYVGHLASRDHLRQWKAECRRQEWTAITRAASRITHASAARILPHAFGLSPDQALVDVRQSVGYLMAELGSTIFIPKTTVSALSAQAQKVLEEAYGRPDDPPNAIIEFRQLSAKLALEDLSDW